MSPSQIQCPSEVTTFCDVPNIITSIIKIHLERHPPRPTVPSSERHGMSHPSAMGLLRAAILSCLASACLLCPLSAGRSSRQQRGSIFVVLPRISSSLEFRISPSLVCLTVPVSECLVLCRVPSVVLPGGCVDFSTIHACACSVEHSNRPPTHSRPPQSP